MSSSFGRAVIFSPFFEVNLAFNTPRTKNDLASRFGGIVSVIGRVAHIV